MEADRLSEGREEFDGYWQKGYPRSTRITWKPVIDNNSRAALMQTGEAQFTFPVPYEQAEVLKAKADLDVVAAPSIIMRYLSMNTLQKPFDNPESAAGDRLRDQQGRRGQGRIQRLRRPRPMAWCRKASNIAVKHRCLALRPGQGETAAGRSGLPERFRDRAVVGVQPLASRRRSRSCCSSNCSRSASRPRSPCSRPGSASRRWKAGRTRRPPRCASTTSAGRRRPARRTGRCGRCSVPNPGRRGFSTPPITRAKRSTPTSRARS